MSRVRFNGSHTLSLVAVFLLSLLMNGAAKANWFADNDVAIGIEAGNLESGFSAKFPYSSDTSWQLTLGGGGDGNGIGGRFLAQYSQWNDWRFFWYGGLSVNSRGSTYYRSSETYLGVSAGAIFDYDLTNIDAFPIPLSINFTVGPSYAFSDYKGFNLINIGMGLHYRFE